MCIIIDNNKFGEFDSPDAVPIRKWLQKSGHIVYCIDGKFEEVPSKARGFLIEYERKGKATCYLWDKVKLEMASLPGEIKSDDEHILALARVSGARLLFSGDKNLHDDFKNAEIIGNPSGKVYQSQKHKRLLTSSVCKKTA